MFLLKSCIFAALLALICAEPVDFKNCGDVAVCDINAVAIDPCPQAAAHHACNLRRRKTSKMTFDFTPSFDAETLEAGLSWVKDDTQELPLITMDREACKYTPCPVKSGVRQTYSMDVPIENKFPLNTYTIKWTLKEPSGKVCCFTTDIKLVR